MAQEMKEFVESLKETYIERQLNCEKQWPPVSVEKLINLQLLEAEKKEEGFRAGLPQYGAPYDNKVKHNPILYGDLFKVEEGKKPVRKLLVEGNAGIGKTTLCTMLTEQWANGEILTQFDCVLLFPLRNKLVASATSLPDLLTLYHPDETVRGCVDKQLKRTRGKNVLIIADGWDELSDENRSENSFIYNLLFEHFLPSASVLLTSRPFASAPLHDLPTVGRLVEVVGFNEENVKQFIESVFEKCPEKVSTLIEQLESNLVIQSICFVPLNCAIICNLWHTLDRELPKTLTELYVKIVLNLIFRNLKIKKKHSEIPKNFQSFDDIPVNDQEIFWLTCEFAYKYLLSDQIEFMKTNIEASFQQILDSKDNYMCLGLLQVAQSLLPVGHGSSFHFTHQNIQTFLAALHLATLPSKEKVKVCEAHFKKQEVYKNDCKSRQKSSFYDAAAKSDQIDMMWKFVFGLGCKKDGSYSRKVVCLDDEILDQVLSIISIGRDDRNLILCHFSLESLNDTVSSKVSLKMNGSFQKFDCFSLAYSPHDCVAVFHVIRHTSHCNDVAINLSCCGLTDKLLKELTDILSSKTHSLKVTKLSLYSNKLTNKGISYLFTKASSSFSTLEEIDLNDNCITDITPLFKFTSQPKFTYLKLSDNPLKKSGIQSLETAIQEGKLSNLEWLYLSNTLTDDANINGVLLTTLISSIATHCRHLKMLNLSMNNLGVPGICALSPLLTTNWCTLNLRETNLNAKALAELSVVTKLSHKCDLRLLIKLMITHLDMIVC